MDKNNNVVIPAIYDSVTAFDENGYTYVKKDEKAAVLDKKGNIVIPFKYDEIYKLEDGVFTVLIYGKTQLLTGLIDKTGKEIVSPSYDMISQFSEDLARVSNFSNPNDTTAASSRSGYINKSGKLVVPLILISQMIFKKD
ncbi:MAG: WG repeat-containing protein [Clostridia bacterium]|nr:WG repeat-containing protein [Tissierellia bacterium]MDD4376423.1 WG repeat-containing protein [Clostridia bacterium]